MALIFISTIGSAQIGVKFFKDYYACSYGVLDSISGDTLQKACFTEFGQYGNHYIVNLNGNYGILSAKTGQLLIECKYRSIKPRWRNNYPKMPKPLGEWYLFQEADWWGLLHTKKGVVIKASLAAPHVYLTSQRTNKRQHCYFDTLGTVMCFENYDDLFFGGDYFILTRNNYVFVAHKSGELIVDDSFDQVDVLPNKHFYFKKDSLQGFYSGNGELFYSTSQTIESLNSRKEPMHYNSSKLLLVGGSKWAYLNFENQKLAWIFEPIYERIEEIKTASLHGRLLIKAYNGVKNRYSIADGLTNKKLFKDANKIEVFGHLNEEKSAQNGEYDLYALGLDILWKFSSITGEYQFLSYAQDFKLHKENIFIKSKNRWFHYAENVKIELKARDIYIHSLQNVFLFKKNKISAYNAVEKTFHDRTYKKVFINNDNLQAIAKDGKLYGFSNEKTFELGGPLEIIKENKETKTRAGLYDVKNKSILLKPIYDTVICLSETLFYTVKDGVKGIYNGEKKEFEISLGQYPALNIFPALGYYRYGYDSSSCITSFSGEKISEWQNIIYFENFDEHTYFAAIDTQAMGLLDKENTGNWLVEPKYCAIYDYDPKTKRASVRNCPIERHQYFGYWDEPYNPAEGNWGVIDSIGNWLIEPIAQYPISLKNETLFVFSGIDKKYHLKTLKGKELWDKGYEFVDTVAAVQNAFFVGKEHKNRGIRKLNGTYLIKDEYNWLNYVNDTIFSINWSDSLKPPKVYFFNEKWEKVELTEKRKIRFFINELEQEWGAELSFSNMGSKDYSSFKKWAFEEWLSENSAFADSWQSFEKSNRDFGITLPQYRIPNNVFYKPEGYIDYEYQNLILKGYSYGVAVEKMSCAGSIGPGSRFYSNSTFSNYTIEKGEKHKLTFWEILDKKCQYKLNEYLVKRLADLELDVPCGKDGLVINSLIDHFELGNDSLVFLIEKETNYESEYISIPIVLANWPLTHYFEQKRMLFGKP